ncbi:hypothetical protein [Staphylococcus auricularis]|uniref:hypothetical protein n=1 Tax=Staphylococcus auricularis TaxID=29379 RepID=UPI00242C271B|nr:hypothetical protein [Staphylococcus auricularis]
MSREKRFSVSQRMATLSLLALGVFVDIRGLYWMLNQAEAMHESNFYQTLYQVMPIWVWGALLFIFGTSIVLSSVFFGKRSVNHISNYFMLIGGAGGAAIHFLMASASIYNAINWVTPAQFITMTAWLGFISFIGGHDIYARR